MRRRSPARRVLGFLALVSVLGAQPRVLCGLHCLFAHDLASMDRHTAGHHDASPGPILCHGAALTAGHLPRIAHLAGSWLPVDVAPSVPDAPAEPARPAAHPRPSSRVGVPDRPPPRT